MCWSVCIRSKGAAYIIYTPGTHQRQNLHILAAQCLLKTLLRETIDTGDFWNAPQLTYSFVFSNRSVVELSPQNVKAGLECFSLFQAALWGLAGVGGNMDSVNPG